MCGMTARRSFLGRIAAAAAATVGLAGSTALASPKPLHEVSGEGGWTPARHERDDWFELSVDVSVTNESLDDEAPVLVCRRAEPGQAVSTRG